MGSRMYGVSCQMQLVNSLQLVHDGLAVRRYWEVLVFVLSQWLQSSFLVLHVPRAVIAVQLGPAELQTVNGLIREVHMQAIRVCMLLWRD